MKTASVPTLRLRGSGRQADAFRSLVDNLAGNDLPATTTGEASGLAVGELDEASVPVLRVRNPGAVPSIV